MRRLRGAAGVSGDVAPSRGARAPLFLQKVADGGHGVMEDHPGASVAHDGADLLALGGGIAMVVALLAARFVGHGSAALGAQDAVVVDGLARGAERLAGEARFGARGRIVVSGAVNCHHV